MAKTDAALKRDPTAGQEHHRPDDRFVPVRACELVRAVATDTERFGDRAAELAAFAEALEGVLAQEIGAFERTLADQYADFNPDRDTLPVGDLAEARTPAAYAELERRLRYLLRKANFRELDDVQIDAAVQAATSHGLRVRLDPDRVEQLSVWTRGRAQVERHERTWRKPRFGETRVIPVYRRVVVMAQLKDDPHVILKMFKEIPIEDLEALLPHAEAQMTVLDRLMLAGGGAGALGSTALKLIGSGAFVLSRLLWLVMMGFGMLVFRTFTGYRNARTKRDLQRTSNLYYQNVSNNAGVLSALTSMVYQEEFKEAFLAYAACHAWGHPVARERLDHRVESYLRDRFGVTLDFETDDALETLDRLTLLESADGVRVVSLDEAVSRLRDHWRTARSRDYHERQAGSA